MTNNVEVCDFAIVTPNDRKTTLEMEFVENIVG